MPNNTRTQIDAVWIDGYTPPKTDWADLERKVFGSWNGTQGGAYCAPANTSGDPYVFAGTGLKVTGPTRLTRGGAISGPASAFIIATGAWPLISATHVAAARAIVQPIEVFSTAFPWLWSRSNAYGGIGSTALACRLTYSRVVETSDLYIPLRVVDGSTLNECAIHFRVASRRTVAPIEMPKMRILRVPLDSGSTSGTHLPVPLKTTIDGMGFDFLPLVTTAEAWYAEGVEQTFTYVCDQNNVIDVSQYSYVVHLVEEKGTTSPDTPYDGILFAERKANVQYVQVNSTATLLNVINSADATEGAAGVAGSRSLIVDSDAFIERGAVNDAYAQINGIWIMQAGAWPRAGDCAATENFTPFWIVWVNSGFGRIGATWQCQFPSLSNRINLGVAGDQSKTRIQMAPAQPKGNIYHSLVPVFNVTDLRFQ